MKIYLASNRENIALVKEYAAKLEALGHSITYEWWKDIEKNGADDAKVTPETLFACAEADANGVADADVVWLLAPRKGGTGCWVELGMAIALVVFDSSGTRTHGTRIIVSGAFDRTLFVTMNQVEECFYQHESAFVFLSEYAFQEGATS